jgi:transposase
MGRVLIAGDRGGQPALLPVDARDLLPADHAAWGFLALVDELDLSAFEAAYRADGRGRPPYDPAMMLALILYCNAKGKRSGRDIAAACRDDLGARVITGNRYPDKATVNNFVRTHAQAVRALLPQTLRLGHAAGLVDVSVVAGDGTKIGANAAMSATVDEPTLTAQIADLQHQVDAAHTAWAEQVTAPDQPALFDDDGPPAAAPAGTGPATRAKRRLHTLSALLRSRQAALAHLRANPNTAEKDWAQRVERDRARVAHRTQRLDAERARVQAMHDRRRAAEADGVKLPGANPAPTDEHPRVRQARKSLTAAVARAEATAAKPPTGKINTTDPASAIMPSKRGGYAQLHNVQTLSAKNQWILAIRRHRSPNDKQAMQDLIGDARANLDAADITDPIGVALFDSGYASADNFTAELPVGLLLVAVEKEARQTARQHDHTSTAATSWHIMTTRLDDPHNAQLYKQRAAIVEPLFAQLFARFGRTLNHRGDDNIDTELHLWAVTHNLLKLNRHRHRRRKHPPG